MVPQLRSPLQKLYLATTSRPRENAGATNGASAWTSSHLIRCGGSGKDFHASAEYRLGGLHQIKPRGEARVSLHHGTTQHYRRPSPHAFTAAHHSLIAPLLKSRHSPAIRVACAHRHPCNSCATNTFGNPAAIGSARTHSATRRMPASRWACAWSGQCLPSLTAAR